MTEWLSALVERSDEREFLGEEDGVARIAVTWYKNKGKEDEVSGVSEVEVPTSVEAAVELFGEDFLCSMIAQQQIQKITNRARATIEDPGKAQRKAEATAKKLKELAAQLGVSLEDLLAG